ncbi:MAG: hypothetical protein M1374_08365 [Firmicutes bacterium]|jgi:urease accessory protein UreF|nr:hypothetical protein [Bacillota bacterium]
MESWAYINALVFVDTKFPSGAFRFSNGIESAIEYGFCRDPDSLEHFVRCQLLYSELTKCEFALVAGKLELHNRSDLLTDLNAILTTRISSLAERQSLIKKGKSFLRMFEAVLERPLNHLNNMYYPVLFGTLYACQNNTLLNLGESYIYDAIQSGICASQRLLGLDPYLSASLSLRLTHAFLADIAKIRDRLDKIKPEIADLETVLSSGTWPIGEMLAELHIKNEEALFEN